MTEPKPPLRARLTWQHDFVFEAEAGATRVTMDGDGAAGVSPMQSLVLALAGCMATDVVHILARGRHPVKGLDVRLEAHRVAGPPARITRVSLRYVIAGDVPVDAVDRAVQLSREKYCSVWHSLRQDIALDVSVEIAADAQASATDGRA